MGGKMGTFYYYFRLSRIAFHSIFGLHYKHIDDKSTKENGKYHNSRYFPNFNLFRGFKEFCFCYFVITVYIEVYHELLK